MTGSDGDLPWPTSEERSGLQAIEALYRSHAEWLRTLISKRFRAQQADADDMVQETWIRAANQVGSEINHPKAFLAQTALNLFRDTKRREAVRDRHRRVVAANDVAAGHPARGLSEQETELELKRIVAMMPETYRDTFVLSRFGRMTNTDIAAHLDLSIKTVEWRLGKALDYCMKRLRD